MAVKMVSAGFLLPLLDFSLLAKKQITKITLSFFSLFLPQPPQAKAWKSDQSLKTEYKGVWYLQLGEDFTVKYFLSSKCQLMNRNTLQHFARFREVSFRERKALAGFSEEEPAARAVLLGTEHHRGENDKKGKKK